MNGHGRGRGRKGGRGEIVQDSSGEGGMRVMMTTMAWKLIINQMMQE